MATSTAIRRSHVVGVFDDHYKADEAVTELIAAGFTAKEIGTIVRDSNVPLGEDEKADAYGEASIERTATGAVTGAILGGALGAVSSILIPGFGPVLLTGMLVMASAFGLRSLLSAGPASAWGPWLIALYGAGLFGAGIFSADPAFGFPPGTPADEHSVSFHGLMHLVTGAVGFAGLIAACFVIARRFSRQGRSGWTSFSRVTGVVYSVAFLGIATGSQQGGVLSAIVILAFTGAVILGWAWLSAMELELTKETAS